MTNNTCDFMIPSDIAAFVLESGGLRRQAMRKQAPDGDPKSMVE